MKKLLCFTLCLAAVAALGSCKKKVAATPGEAARIYTEHIMNDNYGAFVEAIVFTEPVAPEVRKTVNALHAQHLRTVHHPNVTERGGVKEVKVVSQKISPDNSTADVVLTNTYNDGLVETVNYQMVNDNTTWKIRVTPNKEVWRAVTSDGDHEVIKIREGHARDFIKEKDHGERHFVKDIVKRNGEVEVIKVLENGQRHREVFKTIDDGNRLVEKIKLDGDKLVEKDIETAKEEILKAKETIDGKTDRVKEVIQK